MSTIKSIRSTLGLTQVDLARLAGCTQGAIGQFERGEASPSIETAKRLVASLRPLGLDLSLDQLYGLQPLPEPAKQAVEGV
ncbi:XRE family transcriptional regulator [Corticibacter populi]|uniref:XRE family transcriptional regulator n=1 Tax=Corticibacter populi TaxID=1550736 RepID=A0A3M6QZV7_9BURK|nr:helix-turn-helix transcriptional regulator [Corticibacter populi]RMX08518.1 XRE family transcriptional regulator [Corticibacter populi]RZS35835.1 putative transcriptional regulator [Corticibacter populi]